MAGSAAAAEAAAVNAVSAARGQHALAQLKLSSAAARAQAEARAAKVSNSRKFGHVQPKIYEVRCPQVVHAPHHPPPHLS